MVLAAIENVTEKQRTQEKPAGSLYEVPERACWKAHLPGCARW
jgi:hypothetical protein